MLHKTIRFGRLFCYSPSKAAEASRESENLLPSIWIFISVMIGFALLMSLKPPGFPDAPTGTDLNLTTDIRTFLWQPVLQAAWIAYLVGMATWFSKGSLPVRMASGLLWTAAPFIWIVAYTESAGFTKTLFLVGVIAWNSLFIPLLRPLPWSRCRPVVCYMLGLNAIGIPILGALVLSTMLGFGEMFKTCQALGGLWILGAGTMGLRDIMGLRLPRAFMTLLFSVFLQFALAFSLHFLGAQGILKALLYG